MRIFMLKDRKKKIHLSFEVQDTGVGMAPHQLENLFRRFKQGILMEPKIFMRYSERPDIYDY